MIVVETANRSGADADEAAAAELARGVLADEGIEDGELGIAFVGPDEMRMLKREHLGIDEATDVLSFPSDKSDSRIGDLAISAARARAQARRFGHSTEVEIRILMLHGVLHLTGLDHETDSGAMARAEKRWRARLALPNGLIERVQS